MLVTRSAYYFQYSSKTKPQNNLNQIRQDNLSYKPYSHIPHNYFNPVLSFKSKKFELIIENALKTIPKENILEIKGYNSEFFNKPKGLKAVTEALDNPIGKPRLDELCKGMKSAAILIDDIARPTPAKDILPLVIERLKAAGIHEDKISIIVAKGTHKDLSDAELVEKVGENILKNYRVIQHELNNPDNFVRIGTTSNGTPIELNKEAVEKDIRIGIGCFSLSPFAGISSGAKLWLPGISSSEAIRNNHKMANKPESILGKVENPVRQDMEEITKKAEPNYYLGVVLDPFKNIIDAVSGDVILAHRKGAGILKENINCSVAEKADIALVSGAPFDESVYQLLHKVLSSESFLKDGGELYCLADCKNGLGAKEFIDSLSKEPEELINGVENNVLMPDKGYMALKLKNFFEKVKLHVFTDNVDSSVKIQGIDFHPVKEFGDSLRKKVKNNPETKVLNLPSLIVLTSQNNCSSKEEVKPQFCQVKKIK